MGSITKEQHRTIEKFLIKEGYYHVDSSSLIKKTIKIQQQTVEDFVLGGGKVTICESTIRNYIDPITKDMIEREKRKGK